MPIATNIRVPLFYADIDASRAITTTSVYPALLLGQPNDAKKNSITPNVPALITRQVDADAQFGEGSPLAEMYRAYTDNYPAGQVYCLPVSASGGVASGEIELRDRSTEAGEIVLYINSVRIAVAVSSNTLGSSVAASLIDAINGSALSPVSATIDSSASNKIKLRSKFSGTAGTEIKLTLNLRGEAFGEKLPTGLRATIKQFTGGSGNPSYQTAIANLGDANFDHIVLPIANTQLTGLTRTLLAERWQYDQQIYGHAYTASRGNVSDLIRLGEKYNDPHLTLAGYEADSVHPPWEYAAAYAGRNAAFLDADPARPTQTGELTGILPAPAESLFTKNERNGLLHNGIATSVTTNGVVRIERAITTYQQNAQGVDDASYLDIETLFTTAYVIRYLRSIITSKYARHKVADDGQRIGAGQSIVTPKTIASELIAAYAELSERGLVEDEQEFAKQLQVSRNPADPNRIDVVFPADYVNQLRVFALVNQFQI